MCRTLPLDVVVITEAGRHYAPGWSEHDGWPVYAVPQSGAVGALLRSIPAFLAGGGMRRYRAMHIAGLSKAAQIVGLLGLVSRIPVIAEMTVDPDPVGTRWRDRIAMLPVTKAALLIALNDTIRKWFLALGAPVGRIWQRPNPVDITKFSPPTEAEVVAARKRFGIPDGAEVVVVFGRFQPRKNQRFAVEALSRLPGPTHLLLAGPVFPDDRPYVAALEDKIRSLGVADRVTIHGQEVGDARVLYAAVDQLWLTSTREGLPNVMLEALCCGVPVIANRGLGLDRYVIDGVNGINADLDVDSFAQAVRKVSTISADRRMRGDIADRARTDFDAERLCREFAERLARVMR
mgnify:CR=1 FL=1